MDVDSDISGPSGKEQKPEQATVQISAVRVLGFSYPDGLESWRMFQCQLFRPLVYSTV